MDKKDENSNDDPLKYMEQFLYKKEENGKWIEYWVVCRGTYLLFYSHHCETSELRDSFRGFIELTVGTRCLIGKRKKYSFPFYLATQKAKYYFKTQTLLLRHQWIHAINLSLKGRHPEIPPSTLPSPNSTRKQEIGTTSEDDEPSGDMNTSTDSTQIISTENDSDSDLHTTDLPKHVIMVTSMSDGSNEVTNFTSENVSSNTNNYRVTNFLKTRSDETKNNGFVNLSYEEDNVTETENKANSKKNVSFRNVSPQHPVIKPPIHSSTSPSFHKSDKWLNRVTRSADSNRGSTYDLLGSIEQNSSSFLNVKPSANNLSINTSRFSRHLVCSAPDLQALTVEQL